MGKFENPALTNTEEVKDKPKQNKNRKALVLREIRKLGMSFALGTSLLMGFNLRIGDEYGPHKEAQHVEMFKKGQVEKKDIKIDLSPIEIDPDDYKLSAGHLQEILLETFPLSWVDNVSSIKQVVGEGVLDSKIGNNPDKNSVTVAACGKDLRAGVFLGKSKIIFGDKKVLRSFQDVNKTLSHELGHAYQNTLTASSNQELDQKIRQRLKDEERFYSNYVETITYQDKKKEERVKRREYWAEIVAEFFTNASELDVKDFEIVAHEIAKTDPSFNWAAAKEKRYDIIFKFAQEQQKNPIKIENFTSKETIDGDTLLITIEFEYAGHHYRTSFEWDKILAGSRMRIFYRSDGFIYDRHAHVGSSEESLSLFFKLESDLKISIYGGRNIHRIDMRKLAEINAIS